jgi:hypothetical protein
MSTTLEDRANQISEEEKREILYSFKKVNGKMYADRRELELLFSKFDEYIEPYPLKNMNCNDCRVMVIQFWKRAIKLW